MLLPEALEAGLGTPEVPPDEARKDLMDQERVTAIEEEVELSRLGGSLHGRRVARRKPGEQLLHPRSPPELRGAVKSPPMGSRGRR